MARRARDHAAELRARNALAQSRGYRSRAVERTVKTRSKVSSGDAPYQRAGFPTDRAYRAARREAKQWSDDHSQQDSSRYTRTMPPETFGRYYHGLVGPGDYRTVRRPALIDYMVMDRGMDRDEAEGRY